MKHHIKNILRYHKCLVGCRDRLVSSTMQRSRSFQSKHLVFDNDSV